MHIILHALSLFVIVQSVLQVRRQEQNTAFNPMT